MTPGERQLLNQLLERAIRGNEEAVSDACAFVEEHRKPDILAHLCKAGVVHNRDDAYQDVLLTLRCRLSQLCVVDAFDSWFWRLQMDIAKKHRPRYICVKEMQLYG